MTTLNSGYIISNPSSPPTIAAYALSGLLNGTYKYAYSYVTGYGETEPSPTSTITVVTGRVVITAPALPQYVNKVNIYRTVSGGSDLFFLKSIKRDFIDDGSLPLGSPPLDYSTASARHEIKGEIRMANSIALGSSLLAAAGLTSQTAPEISTPLTIVPSTSVGGGVRLPTVLLDGGIFKIYNKSGADVKVYPSEDTNIDIYPVDVPVTVTDETTIELLFRDGSWSVIPDSSGGGGGGTSLASLSDVSLNPLSNGNILSYNGFAWTNRNIVAGDGLTSTLSAGNITLDADEATVSARGIIFGDVDSNHVVIGNDTNHTSVPNGTILVSPLLINGGPISGVDNILVGTDLTGSGLSTGNQNILVGKNAATNLTTGSGNVAVGNDCAQGLSTSSNTVTIGNDTSTSGNAAVCIGYESSSTAPYSVSIGNSASAAYQDSVAVGRSATTGAVGQLALSTQLTHLKADGLTSHPNNTSVRLLAADASGIVKKDLPVRINSAINGNVLKYDGTEWINDVAVDNITGSNLGAGGQVFKSRVGDDLQFRSLVAGSGVNVTQNANDLTIDVTGTTTASNLGIGKRVFKSKVADDLQFRSLTAGSGVTLTENASDIVIDSTGTMTVSNLGAGGQVYKSTVGNDIQLRSIVAGAGVSVTQNANDITLSATDLTTASNLGAGGQIFSSKVGNDLQLRSIVAGSGVSVTQNANDITLSAADLTTASNLGAGSQVFKSKVGDDLQFRSLVAGSGVSLTQNANDITLSSSSSTTASNLGAGSQWFKSLVGNDLQFRTAVAGSGITLTQGADTVTIDAADLTDGINIGTGARVFKVKSGNDLRFRTIIGGNSLTATQNLDDITVDADNATVSARGVVFGDVDSSHVVLGNNTNHAVIPANTILVSPQLSNGGPLSGAGNVIMGTGTCGGVMTSGINNVLIGLNSGANLTTGNSNVIIGNGAGINLSTTSEGVSIGNWATTSSTGAVTLGSFATSSGVYGVALGGSAAASGTHAIALGMTSTCSGNSSVALGAHAAAAHDEAIALGHLAVTSAANELAVCDAITRWKSVGLSSHSNNTLVNSVSIDSGGIVKKGIPLQINSPAAADLLYYDGAKWVNYASSSIFPMGAGEIYFENTTPATINLLLNTPVVLNPATTLKPGSMNVDMPANGQWRYTGSGTHYFHVAVTISGNAVGSSYDVTLQIHKNGVAIPGSKIWRSMSNTAGYQMMVQHIMVDLTTNDYLEAYMTNLTNSNDFNLNSLNIFGMIAM